MSPGDGGASVGLKETLTIGDVTQCVAKCGRLSGETVSVLEGRTRCGGMIPCGVIR